MSAPTPRNAAVLVLLLALAVAAGPIAGCDDDSGGGAAPPDSSGPADAGADVPVAPPDAAPDALPDAASDATLDVPADLGPPRPVYPLDDTLRLSHVQMLGTHNSYHVSPAPGAGDLDYTHEPLEVQAGELGVRQFELDVHRDPAGGFRVFHLAVFDEGTTCATLRECLTLLRGWSDAHPGHHALVVVMEPKDRYDTVKLAGHYDEWEAEVLSVWPRERIVTPDDVRGAHPTLRAALETDGWPTLGATRDRVLFVMLDSDDHEVGYLEGHPELDGRLFFLRCPAAAPWPSWCGVVEVGDARGREEQIRTAIEAGLLVRVKADSSDPADGADNPARRDAALLSGAHLVNTDHPREPEGGGYFATIPDGRPSRCNPVSAPPECTAADVEALP